MTINRNSLDEWNNFLNTEVDTGSVNCININIPDGPYDKLSIAKTKIEDIVVLFESLLDSDLIQSCTYELSPDKNSIVVLVTRKSLSDGHRPMAEAGAPIKTLDIEFNQIKFKTLFRNHSKLSWMQGIKRYSDLDSYNETITSRKKEASDKGFTSNVEEQFDVLDIFFTKLNIENKESNYKNSFYALKKTITDPTSSKIVHFLNQSNLTFVFQTSDSKIDDYKNYLNEIFSLDSQIDDWHEDLKTHFMIPGNTVLIDGLRAADNNPYDYSWFCKEVYHLVDDYYAMTVSKNSVCSNSHRIMNSFIDNFETLPFDWDNYPANLYVGNVCKILS